MKTPYMTIYGAIIGLAALFYMGSYFWLGKYDDYGSCGVPERVFSHRVLMDVYYPMGWIECRARGDMVTFYTVDPKANSYWVFDH